MAVDCERRHTYLKGSRFRDIKYRIDVLYRYYGHFIKYITYELRKIREKVQTLQRID